MAARSELSLSQRQNLRLSAKMRHFLSILRMPAETLTDDINREAAENPFLIVGTARTNMSGYDFALSTTSAPENRFDNLSLQIGMQRLTPEVRAAALFLISELRGDGYLDSSLETLSERTGQPVSLFSIALAALQSCDPPGIGARNLTECLALQLLDFGLSRELADRVIGQLDDFVAERWGKLEQHLQIAKKELRRIATLLPLLSAAPIREESDWIAARIPELSVEVNGNGVLVANLVQNVVPAVSAMRLAPSTTLSDEAQQHYARAREIVEGVHARKRTLKRIGDYIVDAQAEFFVNAERSIRPVTRADAAAVLGMHAATFGRAIAEKSLLANDRIYPLSLFFSRALPGQLGAVSTYDVQKRIRAMIEHESAVDPLTDDDIQAQLSQEGVDISRRTVAKYRKCMRIPSSFGRRDRKDSSKSQPRSPHRD